MRTDTDDLPSIDPSRTHLDVLKDVLRLLEDNQPTVNGPNDQGYLDCAECGFPLNGNVKPGLVHRTFKDHLARVAGCDHLRAVAELQAWVRVEEQLEHERQEREDINDEP
jgi:hypothetical protein